MRRAKNLEEYLFSGKKLKKPKLYGMFSEAPKYKRWLVFHPEILLISSMIALIVSAVGIIIYYCGVYPVAYGCVVVIVIDAILWLIWGKYSRALELLFAGVGAWIMAITFHHQIIPYITIILCWFSAITYGWFWTNRIRKK